jgi:hypothetical protein
MSAKTLTAVAAASLLLSGCASVVRGSTESILITTPPTTGASCILSNPRGNWTVVTPGVVEVKKSKQDVRVTCTKDGFQDGVASIESGFEGWTVGNLLIGGLIGLGIDAATGSINDYANAFQVPMFPLEGAPGVAASRPPAATVRMVAAIRPSLGIVGSDVTRNSTGPATFLADPYGVFVNGVAPRSPAAEAGIMQGDIIRSFNGQQIGTVDELEELALEAPLGSRVILGVYRNRQIMDFEVGL